MNPDNSIGLSRLLSRKEPVCQCRRHWRCRFIPGSRGSPGGGNGNPLQYSCLGNPTGRGDWRAVVYGVTKSQTRLNDWAHTHTHTHRQFYYQYLHFIDEETEVQRSEYHVGSLHLQTINTLKHTLLTFVLKVRVRRSCVSQYKSTLISFFNYNKCFDVGHF